MSVNEGDNYDPNYPEGIDFTEIGVEEYSAQPIEKEGTIYLSKEDEDLIEFEYKFSKID